MNPKFSGYAHPDALVDTEWLAANLNKPGLRIVESNEDLLLYETGHIPGAVNLPFDEIDSRLAELHMLAAPPILYCRAGDKT